MMNQRPGYMFVSDLTVDKVIRGWCRFAIPCVTCMKSSKMAYVVSTRLTKGVLLWVTKRLVLREGSSSKPAYWEPALFP